MDKIGIECIVEMKPGHIRPMRIRYEDCEGSHVVNVDNIIQEDTKKVYPTMNKPASIEHVYKCQTKEEGILKPFTLLFNNQSYNWYMFM